MDKSDAAFRTIGEVSEELGVAQHVLRYWETRFPQLKPIQRAGNRRYYRPADVTLARRIHTLLNRDGYTVKGVQKLLAARGAPDAEPVAVVAAPRPAPIMTPSVPLDELRAIRSQLADLLAAG
ncbi:MAG: MerR family transcriptional regulator [Sphingomonas oligoaromativorans]|jgi:DNA-binding transcriptional MerR regulator|uniref:MerR family transcriptional regulator n=1 Tax=Sphingomonas oligoaromativorans TaxID=575322 RepID=UPI0014235C74|nr:MerR family transcriptional regulator [Sphingomonas oligoaromativorans]NIJ33029.1 DNA-binding transcriptional MerR regulator [Sphingomonas oligoaromativorans]